MSAKREGAIPLAELAAIAKSVQDTVDRIARSLNDRSGRGRPPKFLTKLSALEAVGIEPGSAVLEIEAPHDDYYTWDLEKALEGVEPLRSIEDLAIPGLDADEADAFWHAVND